MSIIIVPVSGGTRKVTRIPGHIPWGATQRSSLTKRCSSEKKIKKFSKSRQIQNKSNIQDHKKFCKNSRGGTKIQKNWQEFMEIALSETLVAAIGVPYMVSPSRKNLTKIHIKARQPSGSGTLDHEPRIGRMLENNHLLRI